MYNKSKWERIQTSLEGSGTSMETLGSVDFQPLPGSDALKTAGYFNPNRSLPFKAMRRYYRANGHRNSLENPAYDQYLKIPKVVVGEDGVAELLAIAEELENEVMPDFLDAAGWAYAEAGLASHAISTVERVDLITKAEQSWSRSLVNRLAISKAYGSEYEYDDSEGHRIALNLAFAPLIKSIVVGNVRPSTMRQALKDTAEIARDSRLSLDQANEDHDKDAAAFHRGFLFEASALMAILYMEDPRYIPLPATARADSGYYHRDQTHDVSIINQHWGEIKKVIPLEIKSKPSQRHINRYKALIIPGKVRLSVGSVNSSDTTDAFYDLVHGSASIHQSIAIEQLTTQLREMLRLYQQGISPEGLATNSLTRFHDSRTVAQYYPELLKKPRLPNYDQSS